jgi:hypothetical protein
METCRTCRFFKDKVNTENEVNDTGIGSCMRYPRIILQQNIGRCFYADVMREDDWCGEWRQSPTNKI